MLFWNGQYESAVEHLEAARAGGVEYFPFLAMSYAELGQLDAARDVLERMYETFPAASLAWVELRYTYYRRPEYLERNLAALRKAGLPEWPFGFQGRAEDRLDGKSIEAMTYGRTWTGHDRENGGIFIQEFDKDGSGTIEKDEMAVFIKKVAGL